MKRRDTRMVKCIKCGFAHPFNIRKVDKATRQTICPSCKSPDFAEAGK